MPPDRHSTPGTKLVPGLGGREPVKSPASARVRAGTSSGPHGTRAHFASRVIIESRAPIELGGAGHRDERAWAGQTAFLAASGLVIAALLAACGPGPVPADGGTDGGERPRDASSPDASSSDAGSLEDAMIDAGQTPPRTCVRPEASDPTGTAELEDPLGTATVTLEDRDACHATYVLRTTATLRDGQPDNPRTVRERAGSPTVRSGNDLFDALHALALEEVRELSVATISDGAFDHGSAFDCGGCFETGRLWTYVWTRDTAYAVDLGLAAIDPPRARASLELKLSERRGGGGLQIVQDTGSGGSYPVSTDRVSWALGASRLLAHLDGPERDAFRDRAFLALTNTLEHDRAVVFDETDGLYTGEQSFLDWREQSYPEWTRDDVVHIAMSKALSTNLLHLHAMELASALATEVGDAALAARYEGWAGALRDAIRSRFWLEEEGLFSTFIPSELDPAPVRRFDLLGSALAVAMDVASDAQAARILASYPHYGPSVPVIWPQQQLTAIYHNRAEWPFVTAYWLRAAKAADNDAVADRMVRALMRGASLNLSNMENLEAASGAAFVEDGAYSGPVVNSQRQLWSVAGYLSMVHHTVFGLEGEADGLHVRPYLSGALREALFAGSSELVLNDYPWRGRHVTVVLHLPESAGEGALTVESIALNGAPIDGDLLPEGALAAANRVDVILGEGAGTSATLKEASAADWQSVFGPRTPRITELREVAGRVVLALDRGGEADDVTWTIYRDGEVVATDLPGSTASFTDEGSDPGAARSPCYAAELAFVSSGNRSQRSPPMCWWGRGGAHVTTLGASTMMHVGGSPSNDHGRFHYSAWGDPGHSLTVSAFTPSQTGTHLLQVTFGNGAGPISTGVTCGIKRIVVEDASSGAIVADGPVIMPQLASWSRWEDSSFVRASLEAGRTYRVVIRGDDEMVNMSSFEHFERYTGGLGGSGGAFNRVNIAELKVLFVR